MRTFQLPITSRVIPSRAESASPARTEGSPPRAWSLKPPDRVIRKSVHVCEVPHFVRDDGGEKDEILR